jgi:hypothetical protein
MQKRKLGKSDLEGLSQPVLTQADRWKCGPARGELANLLGALF